MSTDPSSAAPAGLTTDQAWQQVEMLLEEISQAARSEVSPGEFHAIVVDRLVRATAGIGGAVWRDVSGRWRVDYQVNLDRVEVDTNADSRRRHEALVASIADGHVPQLIPPHAGDDRAGNPTPFLLVFVPLLDGEQPIAMIELFQRPDPRSELQQGYRRIAMTASELAGDYYRDRRLESLLEHDAFWSRFRDFSEAVHASIDLSATAYAIANEGNRLLGCDRLSVAVRRGRRYCLVAMNGIDVIQRRANLVRRIEQLTELSLQGGHSLSYPTDADELPPQIESALNAYLDEAHVRQLRIHPLHRPDQQEADECPPLGALIVERFEIGDDPAGRLDAVAGQAATGLGNALEYDGLPLIAVPRMLRGAARSLHLDRLPWTLSILGLIVASLIALAIVPADFSISARGELQPKDRCHIFAPSDGIVVSLPRADGDAVRQGDILAVLRSPALDLQFSEVEGRRRTVQEQLSTVQTARMRNERSTGGESGTTSLSAEEEQLQEELKALGEQFEILVQQQRELEIRSQIDGRVLTFDLQRLLADRPIQRGDHLMTVANLGGPWELELQVDDDQVGHVLAALDSADGPLSVTFQVNGQPGARYRGELRELGSSTEVNDMGFAIVPAYANLGDTTPPGARPAATVAAKIHCGHRPIGFVWFRALLEAIQRRLYY